MNFENNTPKKIKSGFNVPDAYFDDFNQKIITQIEQQPKKQKTKIISMIGMGIAASLVIMFFVMQPSVNKTENYSAHQLLVNNTYFDEFSIVDDFTDQDFEELTILLNIEEDISIYNDFKLNLD